MNEAIGKLIPTFGRQSPVLLQAMRVLELEQISTDACERWSALEERSKGSPEEREAEAVYNTAADAVAPAAHELAAMPALDSDDVLVKVALLLTNATEIVISDEAKEALEESIGDDIARLRPALRAILERRFTSDA
jgi:hypothetical protein